MNETDLDPWRFVRPFTDDDRPPPAPDAFGFAERVVALAATYDLKPSRILADPEGGLNVYFFAKPREGEECSRYASVGYWNAEADEGVGDAFLSLRECIHGQRRPTAQIATSSAGLMIALSQIQVFLTEDWSHGS